MLLHLNRGTFNGLFGRPAYGPQTQVRILYLRCISVNTGHLMGKTPRDRIVAYARSAQDAKTNRFPLKRTTDLGFAFKNLYHTASLKTSLINDKVFANLIVFCSVSNS